MIHLQNDALLLDAGFIQAVLSLHLAREGDSHRLALAAEGEGFIGRGRGIVARLNLHGDVPGQIDYKLSMEAEKPARLQLCLDLPGIQKPFHVIPGLILGDNNLSRTEPGHYPNLTGQFPGNVSCSPFWEFRADRASHPLSMVCFDGGIAAISITPYSDGEVQPGNRDGFVRNGVNCRLAHDGQPDGCGVALGYRNTPVTFLNKDQWLEPTEHLAMRAETEGTVFLVAAASRLEAHRVVRHVYGQHRSTPSTPIDTHTAIAALTDAFLTVNWQPDRENFSNMACKDEEKQVLTAWRALAEIGWSGGGVIGYPLLLAGHILNDATALERGRYMLDWVAEAYNPASGLLWEVCGKHEGKRLDWWWSGYIVQGCHTAYVNGSGVYSLLKSYGFCRDVLGEDHPQWLETGVKALDTIVGLQEPSGNFGFTYNAEQPLILDREGFAGVWFSAALAHAYRLTRRQAYLDAARRGLEYYHRFVRDLNCWGTPLDTWKSVDQEGNLGFIRAASLLHQITSEPQYLQMLEDGAHYEYLWRYGFAARAEYAPLKGSHWGSCGGSLTSVSNPHIHPMGVFVANDLQYLAAQTGSEYHRQRFEDGQNFGINIVSLYPNVAGYGTPGVLTERFCPSDGLTIETFSDGSPSSLWFSYNGWAAAAVLEGLAEPLVFSAERTRV